MSGKANCVTGILFCAALTLVPGTLVAQGSGDEDAVWLGVLIDDQSLDGGVLLMAVIPGGPAEAAGLQRGDLLLEADGRGLVRAEDLEAVLSRSGPGEQVRLKVLRAGSPQERRVTLAQRPSGTWTHLASGRVTGSLPARRRPIVARGGSRTEAYGFAVTDVTPDLRAYYGAPEEAGVLVTEVLPGRAAQEAGLRVGDVLVQIGTVEVRSAVEVDELLPVDRTVSDVVEARIVRESRPSVARLAVPSSGASPATTASFPGRARDFEALERLIELEIDQVNRRLRELEARLEQLREARPKY